MRVTMIHASLIPEYRPKDNDLVELINDFVFIYNGKEYTIPKGYSWDGASIPRWAWMTTGTPFDPEHIGPSLIHDYMCENPHITGSQAKADAFYRKNLARNGVGVYRRFKEYYAVRAFQIFKGKWK